MALRYQAIDPKNQQRQHQAHMSSILRKKKKDEGEDEVLLGVGDTAPDFELFDHEGTKHKLSDFRGKRVLLSFFRYASWPLCLYNVDRLKQQADFSDRCWYCNVVYF